MSAGTSPGAEGSVITLPEGGGAVAGLGESFGADPFTGTGSFSVPLTVPAGRRGLQPHLSLDYHTGDGSGPFGAGWRLGPAGVTRRTSRGVPRYDDERDVFLLSGAEDLVPVPGGGPGRTRYRPRTEGLFARIERVRDDTGDYWEVRGRDGLRHRYGTPRPPSADAAWRDPAAVADPGNPGRIFGWRLTETRDPMGNMMRYDYLADRGDQPLLARVSYADHGSPDDPSFLVTVDLEYEPRPDPITEHRAGFPIRTTLRCRVMRVATHAADGVERVSREYRLAYAQAAFNGMSLLTGVTAAGIDGDDTELLPPLTFGYSSFEPSGRRFTPVTGPLPEAVLTDPAVTLVDARGTGLPDVVTLGPSARLWRNAGGGRFEQPRPMASAPPFRLDDPGVRLLDADGDGRADLMVTAGAGGTAGFFPVARSGGWDGAGYRSYPQAPSVTLADPAVRLIDLDGDGLTDVLRSGDGLRCWYNDPDPRKAWRRSVAGEGPDLDLADPRVRLADMTGDGLQDLVRLHDGTIEYWPSLGHGRWGRRVVMRDAPRLPAGYDPARVLLGDLDGDGVADLVYLDHGRILLWGNRGGETWTPQPIVVRGTPDPGATGSAQLCDLRGTGMTGILIDLGPGRAGSRLRFLDLTGGVKPYLLTGIDNHLGGVTTVTYAPSTEEFLRDERSAATRWRTTLPFPVQVVTGIEVRDAISGGRLTVAYRYHHGHWDGSEREFRGFAMVERFDTEVIGGPRPEHHSPPTLTRSWFHPGPVDGAELDLSGEYWSGDRPPPRPPAPRASLRALRGQLLRTELYALDGSARADRPYAVSESVCEVRVEAPGVLLPYAVSTRVTQWERGDEPMTRLTFTPAPDRYGLPTGELTVAVPRTPAEPYLATWTTTEYARRDDDTVYLADRVCRTTAYEVDGDRRRTAEQLRDAVFAEPADVLRRVIAHQRIYYDGAAFTGLPLGVLGAYGLPTRAESLAFTDAFLDGLFPGGDRPPFLTTGGDWPAEYPPEFRAATPPLAGHLHYRDDDVPGSPSGYYLPTARHLYDLHVAGRAARGLPITTLDRLGAPVTVDYDEHDLLPVRSTDAAGLVVTAVHDRRLLLPREVTDPNGNGSTVEFSPAGLVTARHVRGKAGEGDRMLPGVRITYDLRAFDERGEPASVRTDRRVHHDGDPDVEPARRDEALVSVSYTDGLGRTVQTRAVAEDVVFGDPAFGGGVLPAGPAAPTGDIVGRPADGTVIVSGSQVHDNKGRVVERYEPYFGTGLGYRPPAAEQLGRRVTVCHDPRGQVVRTRFPDGSEQRLILGVPARLTDPDDHEPTPWETYSYDANDNAGRTHPFDAKPYDGHWDTPSSTEVDALGRVVRTVARNGPGEGEWFTTRSAYDLRGNLVAVTDPVGRTAFRFVHDLAGRRWRTDSIDTGRRDEVPDARDAVLLGRDARGALVLGAFDVLGRPVAVWARDGAGQAVTMRQRIEYGDAGTAGQRPAEREGARLRNLLGVAVRHRDDAGMFSVDAADFKGNVVAATRRVIADAPLLAGYERAAQDGWRVAPFRVDWTLAGGQTPAQRDAELLAPGGYVTSTEYDALNRVKRRFLPADVDGRRHVVFPLYDRAGHLRRVQIDSTVPVRHIAYDASGRRTLIAYGNGVLTRHAYDPRTFRPVRVRSERYTELGDHGYRPTGPALQDIGYEYDLAGNLRATRDRTPGSGLPGTPDALDREFTYDPTYRLLSATGREHAAPPAGDPWPATPRGADVTSTQAYTERYTYDAAGGLRRLAHSSAGGFTRDFTPAEDGNRLRRMTIGTTPYDYTYDAAGNLLTETGTRHFTWDHAGRMTSFATRTEGAEPSVHAHYLYDPAGRRVTKLVRRQGGAVEVTHHPDDTLEHHRWSGGANNHVHVLDGDRRIGLVRHGPASPGDRTPAVTVHLADHLGSSTVVLDDTGAVVSREEYTPYGETSFGSHTRKRYRFTGRERDEESGLSHHRHRYLAPWLARFTSADPRGHLEGSHLYTYCRGNPLVLTDTDGQAPKKPPHVPGLKVDPKSKISAAQFYEFIQNSGLPRQLKNFFTVDKKTNTLGIKVGEWVKGEKGQQARINISKKNGRWEHTWKAMNPPILPEWFVNVALAIHSGEWEMTTMDVASDFTQALETYTWHTDRKIPGTWTLRPMEPIDVAQRNVTIGVTMPWTKQWTLGPPITTPGGLIGISMSHLSPARHADVRSPVNSSVIQIPVLDELARIAAAACHLTGTVTHELGAHAGRVLFDLPYDDGISEVDALAYEAEKAAECK